MAAARRLRPSELCPSLPSRSQLEAGWHLQYDDARRLRLRRSWVAPSGDAALALCQRICAAAAALGLCPQLRLTGGHRVTVDLSTPALGLTGAGVVQGAGWCAAGCGLQGGVLQGVGCRVACCRAWAAGWRAAGCRAADVRAAGGGRVLAPAKCGPALLLLYLWMYLLICIALCCVAELDLLLAARLDRLPKTALLSPAPLAA